MKSNAGSLLSLFKFHALIPVSAVATASLSASLAFSLAVGNSQMTFAAAPAAALAATTNSPAAPSVVQDDVPEALNFKVDSIDGESVELKKYAGKVIIVVNVASRCGYTPQYKSLQKLYEDHHEDGLVILGFPCNQFRSQEPGSNQEIKEFCSKEYNVSFDMFSKIDVNGANRSPLYAYLTQQEVGPAKAGDISWNFEKFIIGRDGKPLARFGSKTKPDSEEFMAVVKKALEK